MNYINSIIRILEVPPLKSKSNILNIQFRAQLPYLRNKTEYPIIVNCNIWGELTYDLVNYYHINDYALIEGNISISNSIENQRVITTYNLNIIKLHPFLFTVKLID